MNKQLYVELIGKTDNYNKALDAAQSKLESFASSAAKIGVALSASVTTPLITLGFSAKNAASSVEQSLSKISLVFGKYNESVKSFASQSTKSFGLSESAALGFAGSFGNLAISLGIGQENAAIMSTRLVGLAGDLSSLNDVSQEIAGNALKGIFTGEGESLKQLGVIMQDSTLEAYRLSQGIKVKYSEMDQASKVALRYAYVLDSTKTAQGNFLLTQGEEANQSRILAANYENLKVKLGTGLLPIYTRIITSVNKVAESFSKMSDETRDTILTIAGVTAVIGPALLALGGIVTILPLIKTGFIALISPVGLAVGAIVTGAVLALTHWEDFIKGMYNVRRAWHKFTDSFVTDSVIKDAKWQKELDEDVAFFEKYVGKKTSLTNKVKEIQNELSKAFKHDYKGVSGGGKSKVNELYKSVLPGSVSAIKVSIPLSIALSFPDSMQEEMLKSYFETIEKAKMALQQAGDRASGAFADLQSKMANSVTKLQDTGLPEAGRIIQAQFQEFTNVFSNIPAHLQPSMAMLETTFSNMSDFLKKNFSTITSVISEGTFFLGDVLATGLGSVFNKNVKFDFKKMLGSFLSTLGDMFMKMAVPLIAGGIALNIAQPGAGTKQLVGGLKLAAVATGIKAGGLALSASSGGNSDVENSANRSFTPTYTPNYQNSQGSVKFEIDGTKLKGVLINTDRVYGKES